MICIVQIYTDTARLCGNFPQFNPLSYSVVTSLDGRTGDRNNKISPYKYQLKIIINKFIIIYIPFKYSTSVLVYLD